MNVSTCQPKKHSQLVCSKITLSHAGQTTLESASCVALPPMSPMLCSLPRVHLTCVDRFLTCCAPARFPRHPVLAAWAVRSVRLCVGEPNGPGLFRQLHTRHPQCQSSPRLHLGTCNGTTCACRNHSQGLERVKGAIVNFPN